MKKPDFGWKLKFILWMHQKNLLSKQLVDGMSISDARKKSNANINLAYRLFTQKPHVAHVSDHIINGCPARVYRNSDAPLQTVMLNFHGGGMALFDLEVDDYNCRRYCVENNCTVVNASYRLAPENAYPAAHNDAWAAFEWLHEHIEMLHGDPHKVVVIGGSAGGNLAGFIAHKAAKKIRHPNLAAQILIYPWVDMDSAPYPSAQLYGDKNYILSLSDINWFAQSYCQNPNDFNDPSVNLIKQTDFSKLAPALVFSAECDILRDQDAAYARKISDAGVLVRYLEYKDNVHGFHSITFALKKPNQFFDDVRAFMHELSL